MTDRPILFSGPMVRALLDGSKTQTRRLVKPQPPEWVKAWNGSDALEHFFVDREQDDEEARHWPDYDKGLRCPYGQPGDKLWVREAWRVIDVADCFAPRELTAAHRIWYEANEPHDGPIGRYRPGMFMPRWASRITLEITGVRVERLQDISEADAIAEGIEQVPCEVPDTRLWRNYQPSNGWTTKVAIPQNSYRSLWESINGPGSWDANPWVWVVEFRRQA